MEEAARPAAAADVPRLAALGRQALRELASARGGPLFAEREARAEPLEASLSASIADPDSLVLVGTIDEVVVGFAAARLERLRDGSAMAIVTDLYVEEPARQVGVGELLMDRVLAWAADRGCRGVDASALPGDRATKNFFETNGFTARLLVMHHRLLPEGRSE